MKLIADRTTFHIVYLAYCSRKYFQLVEYLDILRLPMAQLTLASYLLFCYKSMIYVKKNLRAQANTLHCDCIGRTHNYCYGTGR